MQSDYTCTVMFRKSSTLELTLNRRSGIVTVRQTRAGREFAASFPDAINRKRLVATDGGREFGDWAPEAIPLDDCEIQWLWGLKSQVESIQPQPQAGEGR